MLVPYCVLLFLVSVISQGLIHSAHPAVSDMEFITFIPDLINPSYTVARMLPGSNERTLIGRVNCRGRPTPGWVHSLAVTENYVVIPEMPLRYSAKNLLRAEPTPLYKFEWQPQSKEFMHVMSKATGDLRDTPRTQGSDSFYRRTRPTMVYDARAVATAMIITLFCLAFYGWLSAIFFTSAWWYIVPIFYHHSERKDE